MVSINNKGVRELRRQQADERAATRATRTDEEHTAILDARPGNSARERARLGLQARPLPKPKRVRKPKSAS